MSGHDVHTPLADALAEYERQERQGPADRRAVPRPETVGRRAADLEPAQQLLDPGTSYPVAPSTDYSPVALSPRPVRHRDDLCLGEGPLCVCGCLSCTRSGRCICPDCLCQTVKQHRRG